MVSMKNLFSQKYSQKTWLCAQYHTAWSSEIEMSKNPKLSNTARSWTSRSVILRGVKQFFWFSKTYMSMTFRIYVMIFGKKSKIFRKSKNGQHCAESDSAQFDAAPSPTLPSQQLEFTADPKVREVLPGTILSLQAPPCLQWEYFFFFTFIWHQVEVPPSTLRITILHNDPAVPQDHCTRCRIRTRDLCPRSIARYQLSQHISPNEPPHLNENINVCF